MDTAERPLDPLGGHWPGPGPSAHPTAPTQWILRQRSSFLTGEHHCHNSICLDIYCCDR